jgi:predicted dehydrogenase
LRYGRTAAPLRASRHASADGFAEQYRYFATCIASGQQPQTGGRYARHVMDILFAADESSISGREVLLTDIGRRP